MPTRAQLAEAVVVMRRALSYYVELGRTPTAWKANGQDRGAVAREAIADADRIMGAPSG